MTKVSTLVIEAQNLAEITALLLPKNYMIYRPEADIDGVDLVLKTPDKLLIECQLKGRCHVESKKYGQRNIWMLFPGKGSAFHRSWYLIKHDELLKIQRKNHGHAAKWNHPKNGEYWQEEVGIKLAGLLSKYCIYQPSNV